LVQQNAGLVLAGAAAAGVALGLARSPSVAGRTTALLAALSAGFVFYRLAREDAGADLRRHLLS
jgi:hypothetical protein